MVDAAEDNAGEEELCSIIREHASKQSTALGCRQGSYLHSSRLATYADMVFAIKRGTRAS